MLMQFLKPITLGLFISLIAMLATAAAADYQKHGTIVDIASSDTSFSTLVTALEAANLVSVLQGEGPFTVFAPTNAAFEKLPAGTVEALLKPENKAQLRAILTYHVVPGELDAAAVTKLTEVTSVEGSAMSITTEDGTVMVDNAVVVATDIDASNGIVHVIDHVILP